MNAFKQQCIELRRQDYTLPEIVRITGRPKTSVHFHIQSLPLSEEKRQAIRESSAIMARALAAKKRGLGARNFRKFSRWNKSMVSLVAHLQFDGEIKHSGCFYHNRNVALLQRVENCMKAICSVEPKRYKNHMTGVSRICYFNVSLAAHIKKMSLELLSKVLKMPRNLKREFIRSFFDDEGCMDFRPSENLRRVRGYQKNVDILYLVQKLLSDFGINSDIRPPNEVVITGKTNLIKFQREFNFSRGVRINGNRPNSIWKKHLEKRDILQMAIGSYKT